MKKFFIKISIILAIVLIGLYFLAKYLENRFINNNNNKSTWIINRSGDTVDYAFLGSSKIYNLVDVKTFIDSTNLKAINLGINGAHYTESLLLIEKYLEKNTVKNLVLEIDYFKLINPEILFRYPFHEFNFIPFMDRDTIINKNLYANLNEFDYYKWKFFPFMRYIDFNNQYFTNIYFSKYKYNPLFDEFGTELFDDTVQINITHKKVDNFVVDPKVIEVINQIIDVCRKKNINIIFLSVPLYHEVYDSFDESEAKNFIPDFANKLNIRYINFRHHPLESQKSYYVDEYHLKETYAKQFSLSLKDSLLVK